MAPFIDTPRTEAHERTYAHIDFSEMPSFAPPPGADDLVSHMRTQNGTRRAHTLATPSARHLNGRRREPATKAEFTPLLHSAVRNRQATQTLGNGIATPAALKPGYRFSSPALPEASMMGGDSVLSSTDETPLPVPDSSSSAVGTPMPQLPRRGEMGLNGDGGNVLTLKEQEEKLEKIDKENFGLKLKIHFLEENLKRTGNEYSQQTIRENTELKTNQHVLERDLKRYRRQLNQSEQELSQYKLQLEEYMEKVKLRHMDEAMRDQVDKLKRLAESREKELQALQQKLNEKGQDGEQSIEIEQLQEQIEQLEDELKDARRGLDEKEERVEDLEAKLRSASSNQDDELDQKEQQLATQAERIEELESQVQSLQASKDDQDEQQDSLEALKRDHQTEIDELKSQLAASDRAKREQLREFETRLMAFSRDKNAELDALQRKLQGVEESKDAEIESLEMRIKVAEAQGDNQSKLAQQAAEDANNKLRLTSLEKQEEIERLLSEIDELQGVSDEVDILKRQKEDAQDEIDRLEQELAKERDTSAQLRDDLNSKDQETRTLRQIVQGRDQTMGQVERLQLALDERSSRIAAMQKTIDTQEFTLGEVKDLRSKLATVERNHSAATKELSQAQSEIKDRDRQLETVRQTLRDRSNELEVLRTANDEPDTQLEGLQSIVRHRDHDLDDLRAKVNSQQANLDTLQRTADERLKAMTDLRAELQDTKQDLEDEIQVLESSLDEAEGRVASLVQELQVAQDGQGKTDQHSRRQRIWEQEKERLQANVKQLETDQEMADAERISMHTTIDKLRSDLRRAGTSQQSSGNLSPSAKGSSAELRSLRQEVDDLRAQLDDAEADLRRAKSQQDRSADAKLRDMKSQLRETEYALRSKSEELLDMQAEAQKHMHAGSKAQKAREEAGRLSGQVVAMEKKHGGEIKGLMKQITVLRDRLGREKTFRDGLAFQKRWFLMMVDMYDACNASQIRMIEEMGISPDKRSRLQRPSLRAAALSVVFCIRARNSSQQWAESTRMQQTLVRKMEAIRGRGSKRTGAYH